MASVNKVILEKMYVQDAKSIPDIARELSLPYSAARKALLAEGIALRSRADGIRAAAAKLGKHMLGKRRVFTQEWKDKISASKLAIGAATAKGTRITSSGYVEFTRGPNKGRGAHVVAMESSIGRRLTKDEVVHHINGDTQDNEMDNLRLMTRSDHARHHIMERITGEQNGKC